MKKKIIFTGFGDGLINVIKYFVKYKAVEVLAVIPRSGLKTSKNFIKNLKKTNLTKSIPVLKFKYINSTNSLNKLKDMSPDLICSLGHNQLFKDELLEIPQIGCLNLHPGLLPFGRGTGAVQGEIINKQDQIGWSCHFMNNKFDSGFLIAQKKIKLKKNPLYLNEIIPKLLYKVDKFYISAIKKVLMKKKFKKKRKPLSFGRYYPKFVPGDEVIDWNQNSDLILRKIRSRSPEILSVVYLTNIKKKFFIKKASKSNIKNYNFVNGQVIDKDKKKGALVKTNDNAIWLSLGSFNKKKFEIPKFKIGTVFHTNSAGNILKLVEKINSLEKKLNKL